VRPNVLAHPSPATGRFLLLIGALVGLGLLAGTLVHNGLIGARWTSAAKTCFAEANAAVPVSLDVNDQITHSRVQMSCLAPAERVRAMFSLAGAALVAVLGLGVVVAVPSVLRRRYRLRPAGERLSGAALRIAELAGQAGVRRPPRLWLGPARQRDAFVFGLPGRYHMVLPTALAVRWRHGALFDPVVRHELAHQRRHDVPLAWLATAVWMAAIPVLTVPVIVMVARGDLSLLPAYLWRAALVMGIVFLIRRQALRSREHDADLHAARQAGDWRPLGSVLEGGRRTPGWWRRLVSNHPTVAQRLRVLADPGRIRGVSIVDGLAAGFLTALLLPLISSVLQVALTASPMFSWVPYLSAALVGPVTGLAVGVGLWRQALIDHVTGGRTWPGGAVVSVVAGLLLGRAIRFDDLALGEQSPYEAPVVVVIGAAAVLLSAGTGRLWADAAARLPGGPRSWWIGFTVNALIFALALWALQWVPVVLYTTSTVGFSLADLAVSSGALAGTAFYLVVVPLLVAVAAMVWRRRVLPTPQWLVDGPAPGWSWSTRRPGLTAALLAGAIPGLLAASAALVNRLLAGSPVDDDARVRQFLLWIITGTLVALAVSFVTLMAVPRSGAAVALVTGSSAAVVAALGMAAANTFVIGNLFDLSFWWLIIVTVTTLWLAGYLLILPVALAVWPAPWRDVPGWLLVLLGVAVGGVVALVTGLVLGR
jgi:Zn-dependent protease with chaperone function